VATVGGLLAALERSAAEKHGHWGGHNYLHLKAKLEVPCI